MLADTSLRISSGAPIPSLAAPPHSAGFRGLNIARSPMYPNTLSPVYPCVPALEKGSRKRGGNLSSRKLPLSRRTRCDKEASFDTYTLSSSPHLHVLGAE